MASNDSAGNATPPRRSARDRRISDKAQLLLDVGEQIPGVLNDSSSPPLALFHDHPPQQTSLLHTKSADKMTRTRNKAKPSAVTAPDNATSPALAANSFMLSGWPRELPEDVGDLHINWKDKLDYASTSDIIETYGDDDADDWDDFAGNPKLYPKPGDLERAVGSAFINRAKSAFRAEKSWEQFEADEEALNSMHVAMVERDPKRHQLLLKECLDNDLRLSVFNQLKPKLCAEIWKQKYVPEVEQVPIWASSARPKKDSKVSFSEEQEKKETEPIEPDDYTVTGWEGALPIWNSSRPAAQESGQEQEQGSQDKNYLAHVKHVSRGQPLRWDCVYCKVTRDDMGRKGGI